MSEPPGLTNANHPQPHHPENVLHRRLPAGSGRLRGDPRESHLLGVQEDTGSDRQPPTEGWSRLGLCAGGGSSKSLLPPKQVS